MVSLSLFKWDLGHSCEHTNIHHSNTHIAESLENIEQKKGLNYGIASLITIMQSLNYVSEENS
jgi:hypothetical protein